MKFQVVLENDQWVVLAPWGARIVLSSKHSMTQSDAVCLRILLEEVFMRGRDAKLQQILQQIGVECDPITRTYRLPK